MIAITTKEKQMDFVAKIIIITLDFIIKNQYLKKIPNVFTILYLTNLKISSYCYSNNLNNDVINNVNTNDGYHDVTDITSVVITADSIISLENYYLFN